MHGVYAVGKDGFEVPKIHCVSVAIEEQDVVLIHRADCSINSFVKAYQPCVLGICGFVERVISRDLSQNVVSMVCQSKQKLKLELEGLAELT